EVLLAALGVGLELADGQVRGLDDLAFAHEHRALDFVLKLAGVAGPIVLAETLGGFGAEVRNQPVGLRRRGAFSWPLRVRRATARILSKYRCSPARWFGHPRRQRASRRVPMSSC